MTDTRFRPGDGTAYVADTVVAVTSSGDVDPGLLAACATETEWDAIVESTTACSDAAVVMHDGDRLHVAVIGAVSVVVGTLAGERRFDGKAAWTTCTVEFPQHFTLELAPVGSSTAAPEGQHRVDRGVVPAESVTRRLSAPSSAPADPFEQIFGHTVVRTVEAAAVRPAGSAGHVGASLGVLVFSTGERVVVDQPLVIGRNPSPIDHGDDRPGLVKLTGAGVSRQHAAILIDRWCASIDDLGSVNGTTIAVPGRPTLSVRPGEPVDLEVGARIQLGGDVSFVVEEVA